MFYGCFRAVRCVFFLIFGFWDGWQVAVVIWALWPRHNAAATRRCPRVEGYFPWVGGMWSARCTCTSLVESRAGALTLELLASMLFTLASILFTAVGSSCCHGTCFLLMGERLMVWYQGCHRWSEGCSYRTGTTRTGTDDSTTRSTSARRPRVGPIAPTRWSGGGTSVAR